MALLSVILGQVERSFGYDVLVWGAGAPHVSTSPEIIMSLKPMLFMYFSVHIIFCAEEASHGKKCTRHFSHSN